MSGSETQVFSGRSVRATWTSGEKETWVVFGAFQARGPTCAGYLRRRGVSALQVIPMADDWYMGGDLPAISALVRERRQGRLILIGASMGAYAALKIGPSLGADEIIAVSPQTVIDPDVDTRWKFIWDSLPRDRLDPVPGATILFDPFHRLDRWHAERMTGARFVHVPYGHHAILSDLHTLGLYAPTLDALAAGQLPDVSQLRPRRRERANYWLTLGRAAVKTRRPMLAIRTLLETARLRPSEPEPFWELSLLYERLGDFTASRAHIRECIRRAPNWALYHRLAHLHAHPGDLNGADAAFREGLEALGRPAELQHEYEVFLAATGRTAP